jgi:hypothetical protein
MLLRHSQLGRCLDHINGQLHKGGYIGVWLHLASALPTSGIICKSCAWIRCCTVCTPDPRLLLDLGSPASCMK